MLKPKYAVVFLTVLLLWVAYLPVIAQTSVNTQSVSPGFAQIEMLNDKIIGLECEIYRINTYFRLENGRQPAGRRWRMMYYQTTNYTCTFAGLMINMIYNFYYYPRGGHATTVVQLAATTPRFVGKAIYLMGIIVESTLQAIEHYKEKRKGFDAPAVYKRIKILSQQLDSLLAKRERLVSAVRESGLDEKETQIINREGILLKEGRDLALQEFSMLHARSISLSIRSRLFNILTFIKKGDATFGADLVRIIGGATNNRHLSPVASISTAFSGYMSAFDPWVEMGAERAVYHSRYKNTLATLDCEGNTTPEAFASDREYVGRTRAMIDPNQQPLLAKVLERHGRIYRGLGGSFETMNYLRKDELHHKKMHDIHSLIYHAIYGSSKASRGTWLIYVGWRYMNGPGHSKHSSLLNGFAGIDNFAGSAYRLADFLIQDFRAIKNRKKDAAKGLANVAMLKSRLDTLDSIENDAQKCFIDMQEAEGMNQ